MCCLLFVKLGEISRFIQYFAPFGQAFNRIVVNWIRHQLPLLQFPDHNQSGFAGFRPTTLYDWGFVLDDVHVLAVGNY